MADRDRERWYPSPDDPNDLWPSVTTIRDAVTAKPALQGWYAREAARYAVDHCSEMAALVENGMADVAREDAAGAAGRIADKAANLGKLFHRLAEAEVKGEAWTCTEDEWEAVEPYMDTLHRFVDECEPEYVWAEATVYNRRLRYAGTCDCGVRLAVPLPVIVRRRLVHTFAPRDLLAGDYKTGRSVWPDAIPQLGGYGMCDYMDIKDVLGTIVPMPDTAGGVVIHIRPDGYRLHGVLWTPQLRAGWTHARRWFDVLRGFDDALGVGVVAGGLRIEDAPGLDIRVRNALALEGVVTLADLEAMGEAAFLAVRHAGPAQATKARELLTIENRSWPVIERGAA